MGPVWAFPMCMSSGLGLLKFIQITLTPTELWHHIDFSKWRPRRRNFTSDFVSGDFAQLGRSKFTCTPNFGDILLSTADILLLPVSGNKRWPRWNSTFGFDFHLQIIIAMILCIPKPTKCCPNRSTHSRVMTS